MACNISLKSFWQGLQLCFRPQFNQRSAQKVLGFQSHKSPNSGNFKTPDLGIPRQNDIWVQLSWLGIENTIRRKVVACPKFRLWWILWVHVCPWFVRAPKVLQPCTNQLVFLVCASPCELTHLSFALVPIPEL